MLKIDPLPLLIFFAMTSLLVAAEPSLQPGNTFHLDFPDLPLAVHSKKPPRLGVFLPDDYSPERVYPLMVWFGGGEGTDVPNFAVELTGKNGWICAAVPYRSGDLWKTPWPYYETMLHKLEATVPNINPNHRVCSGFSSGGAAIAWSLSNSEGFRDYFYAFMPGGAGWKMGEIPGLENRPIYVFIGLEDTRLVNLVELAKGAEEAQMDVTLLKFPGGHHMPTHHYSDIREWLKLKVTQRDLPTLAAAMRAHFAARRYASAYRSSREVTYITEPDEAIHAEAAKIMEQAKRFGETQSKTMLAPEVTLATQKQFIEDWKGCDFITEIEAVCIAAAEEQLAKILGQNPVSAAYLKRFIEIWGDLPTTRQAIDALETHAAAELTQVSEMPAVGSRFRALRAFVEKWQPAPSAERALAMAETLAKEELESIKAIDEKNRKRTMLTSFVRDYPGTAAEKEAAALIEELSGRRR